MLKHIFYAVRKLLLKTKLGAKSYRKTNKTCFLFKRCISNMGNTLGQHWSTNTMKGINLLKNEENNNKAYKNP